MDKRPLSESAGAVPEALGRLRAALNASFTDVSRGLDLTPQQAELLCATLRPRPIGELARMLHCDRSNVSRMVDRSVASGLLERHGQERDGRVSEITLTPSGKQLASDFIARLEALTRPLVEAWSEERKLEATNTLHELSGALEANCLPPAPGPERPTPGLASAPDR